MTAGIELGLVLAAELFGAPVAQAIQLAIEYAPAPPFDSGSPRTAPADVRAAVTHASGPALAERRVIAERVAQRRAHLFDDE